MNIYRFEGRGWKLCEPEVVPTLLKLKGIALKRLRRGRRLPECAREHDLFLLMTVHKNTRLLLGGMMQLMSD